MLEIINLHVNGRYASGITIIGFEDLDAYSTKASKERLKSAIAIVFAFPYAVVF